MAAVVIMSDAGGPSVRSSRRLFFTGFSQTGARGMQKSADEQQNEVRAARLTTIDGQFADVQASRNKARRQASSRAVTVSVAAR
jgi:hypothetical protein